MTRHDLIATTADGSQSVNLAGRETDENGCTIEALTEGTQWGVRQPLVEALLSMLRGHGDFKTEKGSGNRLPTVNLMISGPSLGAITSTEGRLQRDFAGQPMLLEWWPDGYDAEPCVFEVVWSHLKPEFTGLEGLHLRRGFTWEFDAFPYARAKTLAEVSLSTGSPTVVDDGTSLTGWQVLSGPASLSLVGGKVRVSGAVEGNDLLLHRPVAVERGDYILIHSDALPFSRVLLSSGGTFGPSMPFAGVIGGQPSAATLAYGPAPRAFTASALWLRVSPWSAMTGPAFTVDRIETTSGATSGRQAVLSFDAGGSAPTYGDMHIRDTDLGLVLLHTSPRREGYTPLLSPWVGTHYTTAEPVADVASPSGRAWPLQGGDGLSRRFSAEVPALHFRAKGTAVLWALVKVSDHTSPVTLHWSTASFRAGTKLPGEEFGAIRHKFKASNVYELVPLKKIPTPPTRFAGAASGGYIEVAIAQADNAGVTVHLGEAYLCPVGPGCTTTVVDAGDHSDLWVEAPSVLMPEGAIWVGDGGDRDNAYHAGPLAQYGADAVHTFEPGGTQVFLTSASTAVSVDVSWYRRYDDHVVDQAREIV